MTTPRGQENEGQATLGMSMKSEFSPREAEYKTVLADK